MNVFSREAGQARRAWLDQKTAQAAESLRYYMGPGFSDFGGNVLAAASYMNPVNDIGEAMAAGRDQRWGDMVVNTATAAAPVVAGKVAKAYNPRMADDAAQWLEDALMGVSVNPTAASLKAAPGQFVADEAGNIPIASKQLTPAQQQAQDVLDLLTTGRADEVTDDMLAAADDLYLFDNYDLPMDEASRMARAEEMGFDTDTPLYHGTHSDFPAFSKGSDTEINFGGNQWEIGHFLTNGPRYAGQYSAPAYNGQPGGPNVLPVYARGNLENYDVALINEIEGDWSQDAARAWRESLKSRGADGVTFDGVRYEGANRVDETAIFDPHNIRSKFARFDPRLKHLANLSAAGAGVAYLTPQEEAEIRAYLGE